MRHCFLGRWTCLPVSESFRQVCVYVTKILQNFWFTLVSKIMNDLFIWIKDYKEKLLCSFFLTLIENFSSHIYIFDFLNTSLLGRSLFSIDFVISCAWLTLYFYFLLLFGILLNIYLNLELLVVSLAPKYDNLLNCFLFYFSVYYSIDFLFQMLLYFMFLSAANDFFLLLLFAISRFVLFFYQ